MPFNKFIKLTENKNQKIKKEPTLQQREKAIAEEYFWKEAAIEVKRLCGNNTLWLYLNNQFKLDHSAKLRRALDRRVNPLGLTVQCTASIIIPRFEFAGYMLPILLEPVHRIVPVIPTFHYHSKRDELKLILKNIKLKRLEDIFVGGLFDDRPWNTALVTGQGPTTGICRFRDHVQVEYSASKGIFKIRYSYDVYVHQKVNGVEKLSFLR